MIRHIDKKIMQFLVLSVLATNASADNPDYHLELRGGAGNGWSLNSAQILTVQPSGLQANEIPLSTGVPGLLELAYPISQRLEISLGTYPVWLNRAGYPSYAFDDQNVLRSVHQTDTATFFPVMLGLGIRQSLFNRLSLLLSASLGYVPAATIRQSYDLPNVPSQDLALDGAVATRVFIGLDAPLVSRLSAILGMQVLQFDQQMQSLRRTNNFNQTALMICLEARL